MLVTHRRLVLIVLLLGMLSACKTLHQHQPNENSRWLVASSPFTERQQHYADTNQWRYAAKIGLTTPQLRKSANIIWEYADQANNVRLFGPLGAGAVKLQFDQYGVELSDDKGGLHRGHSAEELLTEIVGWPIPIDALSRWLFVLPASNVAYRYQLDADNNVSLMEQLGWRIEYRSYKAYGDRFLPRKIVATKHLAKNQSVVVKLITKAWQ